MIEDYETGQLSLYDLNNDIAESKNLSQENPAKVTELYGKLKAWRQQVGADPMKPNGAYRKN